MSAITTSSAVDLQQQIANLDIALDRDSFMRALIRELADVLCDVVGVQQASAFISVVGQNMGRSLDQQYRQALNVPELNREQVAAVLADLKQRIRGRFRVIECSERHIVLASDTCPFEEKVTGQKAMCMMTSNVFGSIAADNLGYAKVELRETIAEGAPACVVAVHLQLDAATDRIDGREYFKIAR